MACFSAVDPTPPTCIGLPSEISECAELGEDGINVEIIPEPTCFDISGTGFVATSTHDPGDFFPVGDTTVTYICSDASGNSAACDLTVRIITSKSGLSLKRLMESFFFFSLIL